MWYLVLAATYNRDCCCYRSGVRIRLLLIASADRPGKRHGLAVVHQRLSTTPKGSPYEVLDVMGINVAPHKRRHPTF